MKRSVLITGGAGFIGCNTARSLGQQGWSVTVLDNLSREGGLSNLNWLRQSIPFEFFNIDVRNSVDVSELISKNRFDVVIHLAGQVAVTTSISDPRLDLETNIIGTFNVLDAVRSHSPETILLNASTNKVYGNLKRIRVREGDTRFSFIDKPYGVAEEEPLDFHSPYGCSKGAAEQYVNDYARIYGLRCVNFRQSCIYGYRQFGIEDQGWVAWFLIAHLLQKPITIYGNGKQVRDMLFVDDLIEAYQRAIDNIDAVSGQTFNVGGGIQNCLSLLEYVAQLEQMSGRKVVYTHSEIRPGDQPIYISDIRRAQSELKWSPLISLEVGLNKLHEWMAQNLDIFRLSGK